MGGPRGLFVAVGCNAHHSPPLARLRLDLGPLGDVYFYRAYQYAKEYRQSGTLLGQWEAFASWAMWPDDAEAMAMAFRVAGAVEGPADKLWDWDKWNGFLIAKAAKDAARHRRTYAARVRAGKARARQRASATASSVREKPDREVGRSVGSVGRNSQTEVRRLRGVSAEKKGKRNGVQNGP